MTTSTNLKKAMAIAIGLNGGLCGPQKQKYMTQKIAKAKDCLRLDHFRVSLVRTGPRG